MWAVLWIIEVCFRYKLFDGQMTRQDVLLLTFCLLLLPLWESVIVLCFVVRYFMSILVLQSSWWRRESWLLCLICLPGVQWWLSGSFSRCHGVVCGLWSWYFLIILTYYFRPKLTLFRSWFLYCLAWQHACELIFQPCIGIKYIYTDVLTIQIKGAQWLSGRVLDSRPKGRGFEPHRRHCVVVLEQDTFILA